VFRSLASRLTASYVFAAIVLVIVAVAAVMGFVLSSYAIGARDEMNAVARQAPFESRLAIAQAGSLQAAAVAIVRGLSRPGLLVAVSGPEPGPPLAIAYPSADRNGPSQVMRPVRRYRFRPGGPPFDRGGPPPGPFAHDPRGGRYPSTGQFLNTFLHIEPLDVQIANGRVRIWPDPRTIESMTRDFLVAMLPIGLFAICAAWLLGRLIAGQALRPLVETTASLERFGRGDFTPRPVVASRRDEIGALVAAYNAAAKQVTAAFEERRLAEANMRQFIADAGHELRTPLTVIMGFIDVLRRRAQTEAGTAGTRPPESAISAKIFDTMLAESRRMKALIDKLIVLARLENLAEREMETVDLGEVAAHVVAALQSLEPRPRIAFRAEPGALARGYESELHDALSNLVENALKYAPESPVDVCVRVEDDFAFVDVTDRGPGIALDEQERVFSRFYRGREHGDTEGFGLGLAIAERAVERCGGTISLVSSPGAGCAFTMRLPRAVRGEAVALAV
jgi:signal transduction histidine kinase